MENCLKILKNYSEIFIALLVTTIVMIPTSVNAVEDTNNENIKVVGNYTIQINDDNTAKIIDYDYEGKKDNIVLYIPSELDGHKIIEIGDEAFNDWIYTIDSLTIPDTVIRIGKYAFSAEISSLKLPDSIKEIDDGAFWGIRLNHELILPKSLEYIGDRAFENSSYTDIKFNDNLKKIGDYAFSRNWGFNNKTIVLPNSLEKIGDYAFDSSGIENVVFGNGLKEIGVEAFASNNISDLNLPKNIETIWYGAFFKNNLENVTINGDVGTIHSYAFSNADASTVIDNFIVKGNIDKFGTDNTYFEDNSIGNKKPDGFILSKTNNIEIEGNIGLLGDFSLFNAKPKIITFGGNIDTVGKMAIKQEKTKSIVVDGNINQIAQFGFSGQGDDVYPKPKIIMASLSDNNDSYCYPDYTCYDSDYDYNLGNNFVFNIIENKQKWKDSLYKHDNNTYGVDITINGGINYIGQLSFTDSVRKLHIAGRVDKIDSFGVSFNPIINLNIDNGVREINSYAFYYTDKSGLDYDKNAQISYVKFDNNILKNTEQFDIYSFSKFTFNGDVFIPKSAKLATKFLTDSNENDYLSVTDILPEYSPTTDGHVFYDNYIDEVVFEDGIEQIPVSMFENNNIKKVTLPKTLKYIDARVFKDNLIESVNIPDNTLVLNENSFESNLITCVNIPKSVVYFNGNTFSNRNNDLITIFGYEELGHKDTVQSAISNGQNVEFKQSTGINSCGIPIGKNTINIKYLDENNTLISSDKLVDVALGDFTAKAKEFEGYSLIDDIEKTIKITSDNLEYTIEFKYKKEVTETEKPVEPEQPKPPVEEPKNPVDTEQPKPPVIEPEKPVDTEEPKIPVIENKKPDDTEESKPSVKEPEKDVLDNKKDEIKPIKKIPDTKETKENKLKKEDNIKENKKEILPKTGQKEINLFGYGLGILLFSSLCFIAYKNRKPIK